MDQKQIKKLLDQGKSVNQIMDLSSYKVKYWGFVVMVITVFLVFFIVSNIKLEQKREFVITDKNFECKDNLPYLKVNLSRFEWTPTKATLFTKNRHYNLSVKDIQQDNTILSFNSKNTSCDQIKNTIKKNENAIHIFYVSSLLDYVYQLVTRAK